MCTTTIAFWNLVISILTLCAIVFYTEITRRLWKSNDHQQKLSLLPSLLAKITYNANGRQVFQISNVGNGVALNIVIDKINIDSVGDFRYEFSPVQFLQEKQSIDVEYDKVVLDEKDNPEVKDLIFLESQTATKVVKAQIVFYNLEGSRYTQTLYLGKGEHMSDFPRADIKQRWWHKAFHYVAA